MISLLILTLGLFLKPLLAVVYPVTLTTSISPKNHTEVSNYSLPQLNVGNYGAGTYYVNVSFGSPPQIQQLIIDISKAYTWTISGASDLQCNQLNSGCLGSNVYYPAESTSSVNVFNDSTDNFHITFIDEQSINGTIYNDNWNFNNVEFVPVQGFNRSLSSMTPSSDAAITKNSMTLKNSSFINVDSKGIYDGMLGLAGAIRPINDFLPSPLESPLLFLEKLKQDKIIDSLSYSLWLGNRTRARPFNLTSPTPNAYEGKLLLGGVDPSLFQGPFYQFEMISYIDSHSNASISGFPILPMGPVYMTAKNGRKLNMTSEQYLEPVLLDSSLHGIYLPTSAIIQIAIQLGATYVQSLDGWLVPCDIAGMGAHLDFTFDGMVISVPIMDLLTRTIDPATSTEMHFSDGEPACLLKLSSNANMGFNVLGTAFLKNAYVAMDMEGSMVAIAQAKNVTEAGVKVTTTISMNEPLSTQYVTTMSVKAISSGDIPYATLRSEGKNSQLSIFATGTATGVPAQFTAMINSNGLISGVGRSFFDTSRTTTTTKKSTSPYSFFSLNGSGLESLANATYTTPINAGHRRMVPSIGTSVQNRSMIWSSIDPLSWIALSTMMTILVVTLWL
ncbi:hypothetical protein MOUN0_K03708 [Monosporozyma unispora]|nr:hypothetical protein C6P44_001656 [Kazachstania unispora]